MKNYPSDLYGMIEAKQKALDQSIKQLRVTGTEYAEAERDYKILLRTECMKARDEGMPIGLIDKTCYGIPDVAEAVYKANQEAINSIKLQIRILNDQLEREWHSDS